MLESFGLDVSLAIRIEPSAREGMHTPVASLQGVQSGSIVGTMLLRSFQVLVSLEIVVVVGYVVAI